MLYKENLLDALGQKYRASKLSHNYFQHYWTHFQSVREGVKKVCEIGVESGASLRIWKDFFPNAEIHGIDINPKCLEQEEERIQIHIGSQADEAFLDSFVHKTGGEFDIVIDDGSHLPAHQIFSFNYFFPRLTTHGIYVVEDTGGCVGDFSNEVAKAIFDLIDSINYWPEGFATSDWGYLNAFSPETSWQHRNTVGMAYYRWLIFIFRGRNPEDNPYLIPKPAVA
jgi:hypothetical protein